MQFIVLEAPLTLSVARLSAIGRCRRTASVPRTRFSLCQRSVCLFFDGVCLRRASGPYAETDSLNPIGFYGISKARGEEAVLDAHPSALIVRTTFVYGLDPGRKKFLFALRDKLARNVPLYLPTDQVSTPTYNRDMALASILLVAGGHTGIFHVCGPDLLSRYDFAVRCATVIGLDSQYVVGVPISALDLKAARPLNAGLTTERLQSALPNFLCAIWRQV